LKVTGLKSESAPGFIPESCPASFRNADRNDLGIVTALPRNPHLAEQIYLRDLPCRKDLADSTAIDIEGQP
ncbi:MAG: hypothetical protein ABSC21_24140, partial [Terriglobia bacterium]